MDDELKNINNDDLKVGDSLLDEVSVSDLDQKLLLIERERDEYLAGWRRTKADLDNYRREEMKRLEETVKYGNNELIKDLLPVLQSLSLALNSFNEEAKSGVALIKGQFDDVLKRRGVTKIEVELNKPFDPRLHEALFESEFDGDEGIVLEVLEDGYMLYGRVLQPAKVKISKKII